MSPCIKAQKAKLAPKCAAVVGVRQIEQAEDISLDTPLALMCEADRSRLCNDTGWGGGVTEQCLKEKRADLTIKCKLEVFRREVEESEAGGLLRSSTPPTLNLLLLRLSSL
jgi:Golgi apparatus protein 1